LGLKILLNRGSAVTDLVASAAAAVQTSAPNFRPRVGIVLGSGLAGFAAQVVPLVDIGYGALPGFPSPGVAGHVGNLRLGHVGKTPVAILQGRAHYYEQGQVDAMKVPVRTLARLGCEVLLLTNSAGSLRPTVGPGSLVLVTDHINFSGVSPLFGETGSHRFVDMTSAYDPALRDSMHSAARAVNLILHEGVYIWFAGPSFETPAEIRAAEVLGADVVGMSTVPEVILARHAGLRVVALSVVTNLAAGLGSDAMTHEHTIESATRAADGACRLLVSFLQGLPP
jgi:purine nucleotide phosphorylase